MKIQRNIFGKMFKKKRVRPLHGGNVGRSRHHRGFVGWRSGGLSLMQ